MTAILRNNLSFASTARAELRGGGSGRSLYGLTKQEKVTPKGRYSEDPAAELMPAAEFLGTEPDFRPVLEDFVGSPFDPARRRVLGRLMGMFAVDYQSARNEERAFLRRLLLAGNPREGYVANRALHLCNALNVIRRTLALGVAESRFAAEPTRGFLGAVQARLAVTTFRMLGPKSRETIWNLLLASGTDAQHRSVPGADRILERALILKALAARRHRLGPWSRTGAVALTEISVFAEQIRTATRACLAARTTLWPGDTTRLAPKLATINEAGERAGYLAQGELDPVFAWQEHGARLEGAGGLPNTAAAPEGIEDALPELDRNPLLVRPRLHQALAENRALSRLSESACLALTEYLCGRKLNADRSASKDAALAILAQEGFDVASGEAVEAIRQDAQGIYRFDAALAFSDLLSRYTGATYVRRVFSDQITAGRDPIGQITRALTQGLAVPIMINEMAINNMYSLAALAQAQQEGQPAFAMREPARNVDFVMSPALLLSPALPPLFGMRARADAYLAPAALDLLAPPFGLVFPELGIEDRL